MPRDSGGNYSLPAGNPVVSGTPITASWGNGTLSDIGQALTDSIDKGGRTVPTANLPMGGFRLTGLGAGAAPGESVRFEQVGALAAEADSELVVSGTTGSVSLDTQKPQFLTAPTGNITFTFANARDSGKLTTFVVIVAMGATARTITWPASVRWPGGATPALSGANLTDMFAFFSRDGGTTWFGSQVGKAWVT